MLTENIPPLHTRFQEGSISKNEWLMSYYSYRKSNPSKDKIKSFLLNMGKNNSPLADRYRGSFLGLAIGDAFGTTLEFSDRKASESHIDMIGGGPFNLKSGQWTDDTSMALCLSQSLMEKNGFSASHQMQLYYAWWKEGLFSSTGKCFDIGNTIAAALANYNITKEPYSKVTDEFSAGNGSLMRLCPVVMFFSSNSFDAIDKAGESSRTTHANEQSVDACRYFAGLLLGAFKGESKAKILSSMYSPLDGVWQHKPLCSKVMDIAQGSFKEKKRDEIKSSGYVIDTLEAVLWAFYNTDSFEEGLIKAVNLGGDADTIGAIYGQIAGAFYGELNIPFKLIEPLHKFHYFYYFADEFACRYSGEPVADHFTIVA